LKPKGWNFVQYIPRYIFEVNSNKFLFYFYDNLKPMKLLFDINFLELLICNLS
jgi:hypothetical protein